MTPSDSDSAGAAVQATIDTIRGLTDAAVLADPAGTLRAVTAAAAALLGYTPDELEGEPVERLVPEQYRQAHHDGFRRYQLTGRARLLGTTAELPALHRSGATVDLSMTFSTVDVDGQDWFVTTWQAQPTHTLQLQRSMEVLDRLGIAFWLDGASDGEAATASFQHLDDTSRAALRDAADASRARPRTGTFGAVRTAAVDGQYWRVVPIDRADGVTPRHGGIAVPGLTGSPVEHLGALSSDLVAVADADGTVTYANAAARRACGAELDTVADLGIADWAAVTSAADRHPTHTDGRGSAMSVIAYGARYAIHAPGSRHGYGPFGHAVAEVIDVLGTRPSWEGIVRWAGDVVARDVAFGVVARDGTTLAANPDFAALATAPEVRAACDEAFADSRELVSHRSERLGAVSTAPAPDGSVVAVAVGRRLLGPEEPILSLVASVLALYRRWATGADAADAYAALVERVGWTLLDAGVALTRRVADRLHDEVVQPLAATQLTDEPVAGRDIIGAAMDLVGVLDPYRGGDTGPERAFRAWIADTASAARQPAVSTDGPLSPTQRRALAVLLTVIGADPAGSARSVTDVDVTAADRGEAVLRFSNQAVLSAPLVDTIVRLFGGRTDADEQCATVPLVLPDAIAQRHATSPGPRAGKGNDRR